MNITTDWPLVSIIIPVYNGSNYLKDAIDSALSQTYLNVEVIVVNDGSNDDGKTEKIALSYGDRIKYYSKPNGGVSSALNYGIRMMNGMFFSWLSHDDLYLPNKIKSEIDAYKIAGVEKSIVICGTKQIDAESNTINSKRPNRYQWRSYKHGDVIPWTVALNDVIANGSFSGCALLIPKQVFNEVGYFDEELRYCQDLQMWIKIFANGYNLIRSEGVYVCSRVHGEQLTQTGRTLFHSDCLKMSKNLLPLLLNQSTKRNNFILTFILYNAKYNNPDSIKYILSNIKNKRIISLNDLIHIRLVQIYGVIRPLIRMVYYYLFRGIKTN